MWTSLNDFGDNALFVRLTLTSPKIAVSMVEMSLSFDIPSRIGFYDSVVA